MSPPKHIRGLSEIFAPYDGFILDLWGVVHDGVSPLPGAIPALEALTKARKKIWLLSNAPRRSYTVVERLTEMGIGAHLYDGVLTSGEASWQALRDGLLARWGRRCMHIGPERDNSLYEGLDIEIVKDSSRADFVLNSGVVDFSDTIEKYLPALQGCISRNLPMLCANPDRIVHVQNKVVICAGTLADVYTEMGGQVTWFGKPYRDVYHCCLGALGTQRVLAVGDSMLTDIKGAAGVGLDTVLVTSGIHREEFLADGEGGKLERFLVNYNYKPSYVADVFSW